MKKLIIIAALVSAVTLAAPVQAGVTIGISIPPPPGIVIEIAPSFIYAPALGFHVSVGVPYDIVYIGKSYYLYNNGYYYRSRYYNGPWVGVETRHLPPGLRKHRFEEVRRFRDVEYRRYEGDRDHYRGRWHRPAERHGHGDDRRHGEGGHGRGGHDDGRDSGGRR